MNNKSLYVILEKNKYNFRTILIGIMCMLISAVSIHGINIFALSMVVVTGAEGVNILVAMLFSIFGIFISYLINASEYGMYSDIQEYMLIVLGLTVAILVLKKKEEYIEDKKIMIITSVIYLAVRIAYAWNKDFFAVRVILIIALLFVELSMVIIFRRGIAYIASDFDGKKLEKEEIISMALLITISFASLISMFSANISISFVVAIFVISILMLMALRIINAVENKQQHYTYIYSKSAYGKLDEYAKTLAVLSDEVKRNIKVKEEVSKAEVNKIYEEVLEKYCNGCSKCTYCWEKNYECTYKTSTGIVAMGTDSGFVDMKDIPIDFANTCSYAENILDEVNKKLEIARYNLNWLNKVNEMKDSVALQIREMAGAISHLSMELYSPYGMARYDIKMIKHAFRKKGYMVRDVSTFSYNDGRLEVVLNIKNYNNIMPIVKDTAKILSMVVGKKMRSIDSGRNIVNNEYNNIFYVEENKYKVLTGVARKSKNPSEKCGDNYSIMDNGVNEVSVIISDGMGTGEKACNESEKVIGMLEHFLEAGFSKETSIKLINSILVLRDEENILSTVDMAIVNEHTGIVDFIKSGAANTYIKRKDRVEVIRTESIPIGILHEADYEVVTRKLEKSDMIIMMTDGVADNNNNEKLENIISNINTNNPQKFADSLLDAIKNGDSFDKDDMTVVVMGVYEG
ncbi:MAG: SpoIIE family protein phosphatase [Lachnospiraceae bacterium]|nr:SpoIIE family protein phosphatase [Lachnospiraceae bacterium]